MTTSAQVMARIASSAAEFNPAAHDGFIERRYAKSVNLTWKNSTYTVNRHGVVCSRKKCDGGNWYGFTLDPFGEDVGYSATNEIAQLILKGN